MSLCKSIFNISFLTFPNFKMVVMMKFPTSTVSFVMTVSLISFGIDFVFNETFLFLLTRVELNKEMHDTNWKCVINNDFLQRICYVKTNFKLTNESVVKK